MKYLLISLQENVDESACFQNSLTEKVFYSNFKPFKPLQLKCEWVFHNLELANGRPKKHYEEADNHSHGFVKNYSIIMGVTISALGIGPATVAIYNYFKGTLTEDMLRLPIEAKYLFR